MKTFSLMATVLLTCSFALTGCGSKSAGGGASSPKALFEQMKKVKGGDAGDMMKFIAPDELSIMSFSMDFAASMMTAMGKGTVSTDEYKKIRKKYNLPEFDKKLTMSIKTPQAMMKIAQEKYSKVNHIGFIEEVQKIMGDDKTFTKDNEMMNADIKDIKINGDKATATIVKKNKKVDTITFRKVNGKWYLSIKDNYLKS